MTTFPLVAGLYLVAMLASSIYFGRRSHTLEEFVLARRSLGLGPLLLTTWVANFGGGALVGWTGGFYQYGLDWWWLPLGFLVALVLANGVLVTKVRKGNQLTLPDLIGSRYGERPRILSTFICIFIGILAISFQLLAFAGILLVLTGLPQRTGVAIAGVLFMLITVWGGLSGLVVTDMIQGTITLVGLPVAMVILLWQTGGPLDLWKHLPATHAHLSQMTYSGKALGDGFAIFGAIATSQVLIQKILAAESVAVAKRMMRWLTGIYFLTYVLLWGLGSAAVVLLGPQLKPDVVIGQLIQKRLPAALAVILITALLGKITTSTNAILLASGSNFARDLYQPWIRRRGGTDHSVVVARGAIVISGLLAVSLARAVADVLTMMLICFWIAGVAFLVPLYGGYLWKRGTSAAAQASLIAGGAGVVGSYFLFSPARLHPTVTGFVLSLFTYVIISLESPPRSGTERPHTAGAGSGILGD